MKECCARCVRAAHKLPVSGVDPSGFLVVVVDKVKFVVIITAKIPARGQGYVPLTAATFWHILLWGGGPCNGYTVTTRMSQCLTLLTSLATELALQRPVSAGPGRGRAVAWPGWPASPPSRATRDPEPDVTPLCLPSRPVSESRMKMQDGAQTG